MGKYGDVERMNEKQFQDAFCQRLKGAGWHVEREISDVTNNNRLDVVAYHPIFDAWFCFELKIPNSIKDYTKCLRQMIRYHDAKFKYPTDFLCLLTPKNDFSLSFMVVERFFWRWGFGVGNFESMKVQFVNGEAIVTVNLLHPESYYFTPKKQITEIKRRTSNAWSGKNDDES